MNKSYVKKGLAVAMIFLFIVLSLTPIVIGDNSKILRNNNLDLKKIVELKGCKNQYTERFVLIGFIIGEVIYAEEDEISHFLVFECKPGDVKIFGIIFEFPIIYKDDFFAGFFAIHKCKIENNEISGIVAFGEVVT